ncbi:hypothetical protein ACWCWD_12105 [Streptomyces sp. NPDC001493]
MLSFEVASIEMAYARMRELQDLANRSRADQPAPARRVAKSRAPRHKKR